MRRKLIALLAIVGVLVPTTARAQDGGPTVEGTDVNGIAVTHKAPGTDGSPGGDGVGPGGGTPGPPVYQYYAIDWGGPNGGMCVVSAYTMDPTLAASYTHSPAELESALAAQGFPGVTMCPPRAAAAQPPDPGTLARDFYTGRVLPSPTLKVVPDYGIVGAKVYLQIGGENAKRFDVADPLGAPIAIDATSSYHVDWGDGSSTDTSSHGGPYPDGDVTHVYTHDAPAITIRVTQGWTASWKSGAAGGTLPPLSTTGDLRFRVEQVQAVGG